MIALVKYALKRSTYNASGFLMKKKKKHLVGTDWPRFYVSTRDDRMIKLFLVDQWIKQIN